VTHDAFALILPNLPKGDDFMSTLPTILTVLSLVGNVLVVKQDWKGQFLWVFANIGWIYVDAKAGLYEQSVLFAVYTLIAIWGVRKWKNTKQAKPAL
jgi:nicotinamide riboside transporter PnuC